MLIQFKTKVLVGNCIVIPILFLSCNYFHSNFGNKNKPIIENEPYFYSPNTEYLGSGKNYKLNIKDSVISLVSNSYDTVFIILNKSCRYLNDYDSLSNSFSFTTNANMYSELYFKIKDTITPYVNMVAWTSKQNSLKVTDTLILNQPIKSLNPFSEANNPFDNSYGYFWHFVDNEEENEKISIRAQKNCNPTIITFYSASKKIIYSLEIPYKVYSINNDGINRILVDASNSKTEQNIVTLLLARKNTNINKWQLVNK